MANLVVGSRAKVIHKGCKWYGEVVLVTKIDNYDMTAQVEGVSFVIMEGEKVKPRRLTIGLEDLLHIHYDGRNVTKWDTISDIWTPPESKYKGLLGNIRYFFRNNPRIP